MTEKEVVDYKRGQSDFKKGDIDYDASPSYIQGYLHEKNLCVEVEAFQKFDGVKIERVH